MRMISSYAMPNMVSESGASDNPASIALYSSTICRYIGDHHPAQGDLLEHLPGDSEPEERGLEQIRVEQPRFDTVVG
jgi:hypothetical protein